MRMSVHRAFLENPAKRPLLARFGDWCHHLEKADFLKHGEKNEN